MVATVSSLREAAVFLARSIDERSPYATVHDRDALSYDIEALMVLVGLCVAPPNETRAGRMRAKLLAGEDAEARRIMRGEADQ